MAEKKLRGLYLAAKLGLLALSIVTLFLGVHCLPVSGGDAGAPFFFWLSGMLLWAFVTLEE